MSQQQQTVFTRNATGLVKSISPTTMLFANLGEIGFGTLLLTLTGLGDTFGSGSNAAYAALIFTGFVLFEAYIYYQVIYRVGRTSGDYVWISRTISPYLGSFLVLGFAFAGIPFIAIQLNWLFSLSLSPTIATAGIVSANAGLTSLGTSLTHPAITITVGIVILLVILALDIFSPKNGFRALAGSVILALIGTLIMAAVLLGNGPSGVQSSLTSFLSSNSNTTYAGLSTYTGPIASFAPMVLLFPLLAFALPWINNGAAWSGELKSRKTSSMMATFVAVIVSGVLLFAFIELFYYTSGFGFAMNGTASWYFGSNINLSSSITSMNMLTVALIVLRSNPTLAILMGVLFSFWYIAACQQTILAISRYAFGMSFDRLLPQKVSSINDRFHSPIIALVAPVVVAIPFFYVLQKNPSFGFEFATTALGTLFFACMGITAIVYGYKKRAELRRVAAGMIISGIVVLGFFGYLTAVLLNPNLPSPESFYYGAYTYAGNPYFTVEVMAALWIIGFLLYPISKAYFKRKDIDVNLVFKELPPE
jgi:amino acid transporter